MQDFGRQLRAVGAVLLVLGGLASAGIAAYLFPGMRWHRLLPAMLIVVILASLGYAWTGVRFLRGGYERGGVWTALVLAALLPVLWLVVFLIQSLDPAWIPLFLLLFGWLWIPPGVAAVGHGLATPSERPRT